ncbi:MAG: hypothetical protein H7839_08920 [Magnetococcus sp. YQC-5]
MQEVKKAKKQINIKTMSDEIVADSARRHGNLVAFPPVAQEHTTPDIQAAIAAVNAKNGRPPEDQPLTEGQKKKLVDIRDHLEKPAPPEQPDDATIRYANARALEARIAAGEELNEVDARRLKQYQGSNEYKSRRRLDEFYRAASGQ